MKKGYLYTIVFMLVVSAVFSALLATVNLAATPRIEENRAFNERQNILYVLNLSHDGTPADVNRVFEENIKMTSLDGMPLPASIDEAGTVLAFALPFRGAGLWGAIDGYLGINSALSSLTGIVFTSHSETPGLGGRIDEDAFKEQFRDLRIGEGLTLTLKGSDGSGDVDAITGATSTSRAVISIINEVLSEDLPRLEGLR